MGFRFRRGAAWLAGGAGAAPIYLIFQSSTITISGDHQKHQAQPVVLQFSTLPPQAGIATRRFAAENP